MSEQKSAAEPADEVDYEELERQWEEEQQAKADAARKVHAKLKHELRQKHGRIADLFDEEEGSFFFRPATGPEMKRFTAEADDKDQSTIMPAAHNLAVVCVLHPSRDEFKGAVARLSGLALQAANEIQIISSAQGKARGKG